MEDAYWGVGDKSLTVACGHEVHVWTRDLQLLSLTDPVSSWGQFKYWSAFNWPFW